jgi:hypothetical protein
LYVAIPGNFACMCLVEVESSPLHPVPSIRYLCLTDQASNRFGGTGEINLCICFFHNHT